jgi:hypothetical protein
MSDTKDFITCANLLKIGVMSFLALVNNVGEAKEDS